MSAPLYDARCVGKLLGISFTEEEIAAFGPPPEPREGFVTFFDPGWSVLHLRNATRNDRVLCWQEWYNAEEFATAEEAPRYRQVRLGEVPGSLRRTFAEQRALLGEEEEVPRARVVLTCVAVHFLATGERLFRYVWVRCADESSVDRVTIGGFSMGGLTISDDEDGEHLYDLGLASSRKS